MEMSISYRICNDIFNHTSLCQFYQGRLLLHVTLPFEEKPKSNLPGENLKYYRQRKSLTTRQIAERIEVVPATILMYEQNKHPKKFRQTLLLLYTVSVKDETGGRSMAISYNRMWKLLVDKKMSKADLRKAADIAPNTMTKLRRDESVNLAILGRICDVLNCDYGDLMQYVPEENTND